MTLNIPATAFQAVPIALDLAAARGSAGMIEGYASAFGGEPDGNRRLIQAGAFTNTLADHRVSGSAPAMLWAHDAAQPIGRWLHLEQDSYGLRAVGQLNLRTARGQEAYQHIRGGDALGLSMGWNAREGGVRYDAGRNVAVFSDVDLFEISVVTIAANKRAKIQQIASLGSQRDLEQLLRAHGLARSAAVMVASRGWAALAREDPAGSERAALAERIRQATEAIKRLSGGGV